MTERKTSYLSGLALAGHYAAANAFGGNAAADFGAMLVFRNRVPFGGFGNTATQQFLCGNLQASSPSATKGWALRWLAGAQPAAQLELVYGDASSVQQSFIARPLVPTQLAQRTMIVHVFLLRDPIVAGPDNVTMLLYVNGGLVARAAALSFQAADGLGTFRIGGSTINGSTVDAPGIGVVGFGYCGNVAGASLTAKLAAVQAMVDATTAETLATGDVADDALVTNLFSVRRALQDTKPTWLASKGPIDLSRVGSGSLAIESADAFFGDVPWEDLTPVPNPLDVMGRADLTAWWRGDAAVVSGGLVSRAIDLSGNGRDLLQAVGALQPGLTLTGGPNNTPAFVFPGGPSLAGASVRLSRSGPMGLNPGDFPALFVVQVMDLATCNNLAPTFAIGDSGSLSQMLIERRNTTPPGYFGGLAALVGGVGGFNGPVQLDSAAHLQAMTLQALAANVDVDGAAGPDKVTTGGLLAAPDTIDLGGSSLFANPNVGFGGLIPDAWILRVQPSAVQQAQINTYARTRYLVPVP